MFKTVGFIPVRAGSKGVLNKNLTLINGKPLIYWTVLACVNSKLIERVFVSSDSQEILTVVEGFGFSKVEVISRSPETATDTASSESALIEFCQNHEFEKVVFLQATSPLTCAEDLDGALETMQVQGANSLISVVNRHQFLWSPDRAPMNYDPQNRPRRQDWDGYFVENGAFYISYREDILNSRCRISGKISFWPMSAKTLFEIDAPEDWAIVEALAKIQ